MQQKQKEITLARLAQVSSCDFRTQFQYFRTLNVAKMDQEALLNLRSLVFSLNPQTEDEIQFRNSIDRMTTGQIQTLIRRRQMQKPIKRRLHQSQVKQEVKQIKKQNNSQRSLFSYFKEFVTSLVTKNQPQQPKEFDNNTCDDQKEQLLKPQISESPLEKKRK